uniref:Polyprotein protein n=1 Tax=Solanum tuberosum TaxID=4113 RepID=M1DYR6_SOLTU
MGILSRSANVRAAWVEKEFLRLFYLAIKNALGPLTERVVRCEKTIEGHTQRLEDLTMRITLLENTEGSSSALDTLRTEVSALGAEVVQIQLMDISKLWGDVSLSSVAPPTLELPSATPSSSVPEVAVDVDAEDEELAKETDEEGLMEDEHGIAETLTEMHEIEEVIN